MKAYYYRLSTIFKLFGACLLICLLQSCGPTTYVVASNDYKQEPAYPDWAPQYENPDRVSYYYMPDIQTYYDVRNRQFIYYDNGAWIYSSHIPPQYSSYDLYNAYIIVLSYNAYEPWRHHQDYYAQYPPYYYQSSNVNNTTIINNNYYGSPGSGQTTSGGFNENARTPIYRSANSQTTRRNAAGPATNQNGTLRNANQPNIIEQPRRSDNANVINKPATQENNRRVNETPGTTPNVPRQSTINTISSPLNNQAPQTERRSGLNTGASNQPASTVNPAPNIKQDNQNGRHDNLTEKKEQSSEIRNEQPKRPEQQRSNVQPLKKENKPTARKEAPKAEDKKKDDDKRR